MNTSDGFLRDLADAIGLVVVAALLAALMALGIGFGPGVYQELGGRDAPSTPATEIHGAPANTPGFGGSSANPDGGGANGGNGIHNIAGVQANGAADTGQPPACTAHGGLENGYNANCG